MCFPHTVSRRIVTLLNQIVRSHSSGQLSNVLPQMPQNITVLLGVKSLTLGDEFKVHNFVNVKENLSWAPDMMHLPQALRLWALKLRRLLLGLLVVAVDTILITNDVAWSEPS